ncbi:MAG: hypothetical protein IPM91_18215 [Bacteroidetes bacterium]|nr:hypothetical protein [Bacteroidota bacterium]
MVAALSPISDKYFGGSIGAVSIANSDRDIIWVGEGEQTMRGNVSEGHGIWKSVDGGNTWKNMGLTDSRHIVRIRIHPKNPDVVYVCAFGHLGKIMNAAFIKLSMVAISGNVFYF